MAQPLSPKILKKAVIDKAKKGGGFNQDLAFDDQGRPIVVYTKFTASQPAPSGDAEGQLNAFVARFDGRRWVRRQLSSWTRWVSPAAPRDALVSVRGPLRDGAGANHWYVSASLRMASPQPPLETGTFELKIPGDVLIVETDPIASPVPCNRFPGRAYGAVEFPDYRDSVNDSQFGIRFVRSGRLVATSTVVDHGDGDDSGDFYYLRWEALVPGSDASNVELVPPTQLTVERTACVKR